MQPPVSRIRFSETARNQLITLKKRTKIEHFNVIARWGFCLSMAEPAAPSPVPIPADSNLEMSWHIFAGDSSDLLIIALKTRCLNDGLNPNDDATLAAQLRLHLHRGIGYLAGNPEIKDIGSLVRLTQKEMKSVSNSISCSPYRS